MGSCRAGTLYDPTVVSSVPGAECVPSRYLLDDKWMSEPARLLGETVSICALSPGGKRGMPAARTTFGKKTAQSPGAQAQAGSQEPDLGLSFLLLL